MLGLTDKEQEDLRAHRGHVAERDWIQRYVRWASDRTDASPNFHRTMSHAMIATVIDRKRWFPSQHKDYYPNVFLLQLAPSGKRKSVAMGYAEHDILPVSARDLILPNEVTPEGLLDLLASQPSGIMCMDEAGAYFNLCRERTYGSRLREIIPKLYDCPPLFRRKLSQRWVECTNIYLNQVLAIAWDNFLEHYLDPTWITSGFLPRYLPIRGVPTTRKPIRAREAAVDTVGKQLADELKQLRQQLKDPRPVEVTSEALGRLEHYHVALEEWGEGQFQSALAEPYSTRLQDYSVKLAITAAIAQGEDASVSLPHVLQAIQDVEESRHAVEALIEAATATAVRKTDLKVRGYVQKHPGITTREVQRRGGFDSVDLAFASLKRCESNGWLRPEPGSRADSTCWFPVEPTP